MNDENIVTSHAMDLVQRPEELNFRRGFYTVNDAPHPQRKYFWFD